MCDRVIKLIQVDVCMSEGNLSYISHKVKGTACVSTIITDSWTNLTAKLITNEVCESKICRTKKI